MKTQPEYVTGDGGNANLTNQDEKLILDRCFNGVPAVTTPLGVEDDSHCVGVFRRADVAGS